MLIAPMLAPGSSGKLLNRLSSLLLLILVMSLPRTVRGDGPIIFYEELDDTFVTGSCGFPMEVHTTGTGIFHLWPDENGDLDRLIVTSADIKISFTNLVTGEVVWTPSVNMTELRINDDETGTQSYRGLLWHLIVPGEGLLTADVGRIDFLYSFDNGMPVFEGVVFDAGIQENQFIPLVCSVLADA